MNCLKSNKFTNNFLHNHELLFNTNMIMGHKFDIVVVTFADPYLLFLAGLLSLPAHFSFLPPVFLYSKLSCSLLPYSFFPPYIWCSGSSAPSPSGAPPVFYDMNKLLSLAFKKVHDVDPPWFSSLISLVYCGHPCLCPCISCFIISFPTDPFARNSLFFPLNQEHAPWILSLRHISNVTLSHQRMSTFVLESL